eukprot:CAMPEP_0197474336 /NCGR_PEP_ID=MMETSP1309-20131121/5814_1 /TAXON_ID=464262 /ORGANISM="Genus nov. species nov., Strain RCC998" /LENGTH=296 /DNA_ID=CAMNT_0043013951 /DNA_START=197 /DNA_END=1087 /DNA_ORIENTATION=-
MSTEAEDGSGGGGEQECLEEMLVENTESVRQALRQAVANLSEPNEGGGEEEEEEEEEEETDEASREKVEKKRKKVLKCLKSDSVPWKVVLEAMRINRKALAKRKRIEGEAEADGKEDGFWELSIEGLREANAGIDNATLSSAGRNPALVKRLERIQRELDDKKYAEMVRDIEPTTQRQSYEYMSSYKDQLGLGLNMVAVMGTLFALGYFLGVRVTTGEADERAGKISVLPLCLGLAGAFLGMILETILFVIRSGDKKKNKKKQRAPKPLRMRQRQGQDKRVAENSRKITTEEKKKL